MRLTELIADAVVAAREADELDASSEHTELRSDDEDMSRQQDFDRGEGCPTPSRPLAACVPTRSHACVAACCCVPTCIIVTSV